MSAWRRQALRDKARLWTTPGRQPPLFFFMREDTMAYINRVGELVGNSHNSSGLLLMSTFLSTRGSVNP